MEVPRRWRATWAEVDPDQAVAPTYYLATNANSREGQTLAAIPRDPQPQIRLALFEGSHARRAMQGFAEEAPDA